MISSFNLPAGFVNADVVELARQHNANAIVRVVLTASAKEYDAVAFWQDTDAERIDRRCGDSVEFLHEGIARVMALAAKLQRSLVVCREAVATKRKIRDTLASVGDTLAMLGAANFDLTRSGDALGGEIALLEHTISVHEYLLEQATAAFDEMSQRMHALYATAPAKGFAGSNSGLTVH